MKEIRQRTNKTHLSDDELIIFDVLFDGNVPIKFLKGGENFSLSFNYPSHSLDENELAETIDKLLKNKFLEYKQDALLKEIKSRKYVGLTQKGGNLWEMERLPIWEKYVSDSSDDLKGYWELSVFSPSLEVAKDFIQTANDCKLYELSDPNGYTVNELQGKDVQDLIPWKIFIKAFELKARLSDRHGTDRSLKTDWGLYKSKCLWWRSVKELLRLHKKDTI